MSEHDLSQLMAKADRLYTEGHLDAALDAYTEIIELDQTSAWAYNRIGAIFAQTGNHQHAEEALLTAMDLDPKLPQAHSNLGNLHYARGEYEAALAKYKEAAALDPSNPVFHENLHAAYKKLGRFGEAISALKQSHKLSREGVKQRAKESMGEMKERVKGRAGCAGSVLVMILALTLLVTLI